MRYAFAECILDTRLYTLHREGTTVRLRPKAFQVLQYLLEHRDHVVSKDELCAHVWPGQFISDATLEGCITLARRAIGDSGRVQRFIESRRGYGYRFVGTVREEAVSLPGREVVAAAQRIPPVLPQAPVQPQAVGREAEFGQLHRWLDTALTGARQVVFVTGEAGLGKTTLVETFAAGVGRYQHLRIGRGQCIEQYGSGEPYLPVLEAFGRLCREPGGQEVIECFARYAPTWLVQMPWLVSTTDLEALQLQVVGATRERMLRGLAEALERLTAARPLVLVLEDLHWSDYSTLDVLAMLARRREPARLLVLGTYRPEDVLRQGHPLQTVQHELHIHGHCQTLPLTFLTEAAIATYLTRRFPGLPCTEQLARFVHQRTDGNPLFMVNVVGAWLAQGALGERDGQWALLTNVEALQAGMPESLRQMIEQQLDRLTPEEQRVVEVGSVAGIEFSAAAVAASIDWKVVQVETCCASLARRGQLLRASGEQVWPDGTVAGCYSFIHALYQEVVYQRVPAARRVEGHRRIGARLEAGYGAQARQIAAELAVHFVRGHDAGRAVTYLYHAGENALRRSAYQEAITHLTMGLEMLETLPETTARAQQELDLRMALGPALMVTKGTVVPEVEQTYARAWVLSQQVGETPQRFSTLRGLWRLYQDRGELARAQALGTQLLQLAQRTAVPTELLTAHGALGYTLYFLGNYSAAQRYCTQGIALIDPEQQRAQAFRYGGVADGVICLVVAANTLWCLGFPTQAVQRSQDALALAQGLHHPWSLANAQLFAARLHACRREASVVQAQVEALLPLATAQGAPHFVGFGICLRGWALALQGQDTVGLEQMRRGLATVLAAGNFLSSSLCLVLLAEAVGHAGHVDEGLRLLAEALTVIEASGRGDMLAEAYRLQGELLLRQADPDTAQAEACFQQALAVARRQQAKSWELRAATSLSRLWQQQGECTAARDLLVPIYSWFTEGFDTADLREAKVLLDELS
jgi:DNA-binding winged helix-turn-helix (wHTH) protein/predicted ATPase